MMKVLQARRGASMVEYALLLLGILVTGAASLLLIGREVKHAGSLVQAWETITIELRFPGDGAEAPKPE